MFGFGQDQSHYFLFFWNWCGVIFLLGGIGHGLVTNKFSETRKVEGHGVVAMDGFDIMGGVAVVVVTAVLGIRVADTWGSTRGFSMNFTLN